jgi:hypothetical protein
MKDLRIYQSQKGASDPLFRLAMQESLTVRMALGKVEKQIGRAGNEDRRPEREER